MHNTWASQRSACLPAYQFSLTQIQAVQNLSQFRRKLKKLVSTVTMFLFLFLFVVLDLHKSHFNRFCVSGDSGASVAHALEVGVSAMLLSLGVGNYTL